jgi:hypothetical protein
MTTPISPSNPVKDPDPLKRSHSDMRKARATGLAARRKLPPLLEEMPRSSALTPEGPDGRDVSASACRSSAARDCQSCSAPLRPRPGIGALRDETFLYEVPHKQPRLALVLLGILRDFGEARPAPTMARLLEGSVSPRTALEGRLQGLTGDHILAAVCDGAGSTVGPVLRFSSGD